MFVEVQHNGILIQNARIAFILDRRKGYKSFPQTGELFGSFYIWNTPSAGCMLRVTGKHQLYSRGERWLKEVVSYDYPILDWRFMERVPLTLSVSDFVHWIKSPIQHLGFWDSKRTKSAFRLWQSKHENSQLTDELQLCTVTELRESSMTVELLYGDKPAEVVSIPCPQIGEGQYYK